MRIEVSEDGDGFRWVTLTHAETRFRFRELDGRAQGVVQEYADEYERGLATIALAMRDDDDGPAFASVAEGVEALKRRPVGLLRQVLTHGALVACRLEDPDPDPEE